MTDKTLAATPTERAPASLRWLRASILRRLALLQHGHLLLADELGRHEFGDAGTADGLSARVEISDLRAYADISLGGSLGAGESYMRGDWRSDNLTGLVRILLRNRDVLDGLDANWTAMLRKPLLRVLNWRNSNTRRGARRNIAAHYDLGNELFELFLDPAMMYSSAVYPERGADLDAAARYKMDLVCRKLDLGPGDHLLEIGSGWGGLAIHAATHYGCRVTTTTISREQYQLAQARIAAAGLEPRIELLLRDYRDLDGSFDKLVSVEMIEAVGCENYDAYFRCCERLLAPDGLMLLQAITIADRQYDRAKHQVDFIKRYIFPGGCLPSNTVIQKTLTAATNLQIVDLHDIGRDYAQTLSHWRERFCSRLDAVRELGYDEGFIRMWLYYLNYCEAAFRERATSAVQYLLAAPATQPASGWRLR